MRTIVQGPGPGFTTVATRRSVIFRLEGLELVFTLRNCGSESASAFIPAHAPPSIAADVFKTPRRSTVRSFCLDIDSSPLRWLLLVLLHPLFGALRGGPLVEFLDHLAGPSTVNFPRRVLLLA